MLLEILANGICASMLHLAEILRSPMGELTRRRWLSLGALGASYALPGPSAVAQMSALNTQGPGFGRAKSVVVVFTHGGQSQIDMWDPKPNAPLDVRGEFASIATAVPSLHFCEHLPRVARIADRLTVVRSMSHEDLDHGSAVYLALTGFYHARRSGNPAPSPNDLPTLGALIRRTKPVRDQISAAVHINGPALVPFEPSPGQFGGVLGKGFEPIGVGDPRGFNRSPRLPDPPSVGRRSDRSPAESPDAALANEGSADGVMAGLVPRLDLPSARLASRLALKQQLDEITRNLERNAKAIDVDHQYRQAFEMLASPTARQAFDVGAEPMAIRERYGTDRSGQALLLARRLVEAEIPYINVVWNSSNRGQDREPDNTDWYGWDTHNDIFDALRDRLLPRFDRSFAAFIEDLDARGLLDTTLVICMGEFGRAPRVAVERNFAGVSPGRKHWPTVYSIVMAGAGVRRGSVVGASDRMGAEPITERFGPWDLTATVFHALGIDHRAHYLDALDRPLPLCEGRPMLAIY